MYLIQLYELKAIKLLRLNIFSICVLKPVKRICFDLIRLDGTEVHFD